MEIRLNFKEIHSSHKYSATSDKGQTYEDNLSTKDERSPSVSRISYRNFFSATLSAMSKIQIKVVLYVN